MAGTLGIAEVAALVGDPARANMLLVLMSGRAMTAKELSIAARVTPQTASAHLGRLTAAKLLFVVKQGRHRYYRIASTSVGRMIESINLVASTEVPPRHVPRSRIDMALRTARTCYDHLAGRLGVAIADRMSDAGHVVLGDDGGEVTAAGTAFLAERLAIDLRAPQRTTRPPCRPCLDWSERRYHIAGRLGALILTRCLERGWVVRAKDSRAVGLTPSGRAALFDLFALGDEDQEPVVSVAGGSIPAVRRPSSP